MKNCLFCDADISHKRPSAKYCGASCANKHKGQKVKKANKGKHITCVTCGKSKAPSQFSYKVRGDISSGKKDQCKRCGANEREAARRDRTWKDDAVKVLLMNSRARAKAAGLEHTLTRDDIVIPDRCPIFDIELKREDRETWFSAPSIDRIDNKKGYIPDNIVIVCRRANILKKDATVAELRQIADFYERLENESIRVGYRPGKSGANAM